MLRVAAAERNFFRARAARCRRPRKPLSKCRACSAPRVFALPCKDERFRRPQHLGRVRSGPRHRLPARKKIANTLRNSDDPRREQMRGGVRQERTRTAKPQIPAGVIVCDQDPLSYQRGKRLGNPVRALQVKMHNLKIRVAEQPDEFGDIAGRPFVRARANARLMPSASSASANGPRPCMTATSTSKADRSRCRSMSSSAVCAPPRSR